MQILTRLLTKNLMIVTLGALLLVEVFSVTLTLAVGTVFSEPETLLRISEIDGPRIDGGAAMVAVTESIFPVGLFVFLVLAYAALLVFNFSYTFETATTPQWRVEGFLTLCALFAWRQIDPDGDFLWFPFMILKLGLIIFVLYIYLLEKRQSAHSQRETVIEA